MISTTIVGNLGADATTKRLDDGNTVVEFNVACKVSIKKDAPAEWIRASVWGSRGEKLAPYLTKGTRVVVRGALTARPYIPKAGGEARAGLELRVDDVELLGGGEKHERPAQAAHDDADVPF